jgi:short-subunit dehydrogenase
MAGQPEAQRDTRGWALVTGASSGIGAAFAEHLARDGYDLILVARRRKRLDDLAARLREAHAVRAEFIVADLSRAGDQRAVERRVAAESGLTLLVNNAGYPNYGPVAQVDPDRIEEQIDVHITALVRLTRAALPGMLAAGRGAIINVSSVFAISLGLPPNDLPDRVLYSASKAYVNTFSELLQRELAGTGVQVQSLCPPAVRTEFFAVAGLETPAARAMAPEEVVQASLASLQRGESICVPSLEDYTLIERERELRAEIAVNMRNGVLATRYTGTASGPGSAGIG